MADFKMAVTDYSLAQHFPHKWEASKADWAIAVCQRNKECDFRVRASYKKNLSSFQVTVFKEGHVCAGRGDPKRAPHNDHKYLVDLVSCVAQAVGVLRASGHSALDWAPQFSTGT